MFRAARRLIQDLNPKRSQDRLVLEIGICSTISRTFSAVRFLPLFRMKNLAPRIRYGGYDDLIERLLRGDLDILLTENQPSAADQKKLGLRALAESPLIAVAPPALAEQLEQFPEDLGQLPFMHYTQSSRYRWDLDTFFLEQGIAPEVLAEIDDVILLSAAAEQGLCWVAIPETVASESIARGSLTNLGPIGSARATVYAYFQQMSTREVVLSALDALQSRR
jgi:DNA-binding transcriptional LysR family regulator